MADEEAGDTVALAGFVISDKVRSVVLDAVLGGERRLDTIAKRHRIVGRAAERATTDLRERGLLTDGDGGLTLTDLGREVADVLDKNRKATR